MAETITESFCERCGTRYEFKAPTRLNPLRKTRGLIGGLKNYVMSQDALSDAVGDAMRSEEEQLASAQLEAFHESFNFCIDCRQYTCVNCWNDEAGRCRSCAPIAGTDDLAERLAASVAGEPVAGAETLQPEPELQYGAAPSVGTWPTHDLPEMPIGGNGHAPEGWPTADGFVYDTEPGAAGQPHRAADGFVYDSPAQAEAASREADAAAAWTPASADFEPEPIIAELEPEPEPIIAELEPEPEPIIAELEPEPEPIAAEVEPEPFVAEVEPEPIVAEVEPEPFVAEVEPEPILAEVEPEPFVAEVEPEPFVAEVEPEPEPVVAEAEPVLAEYLEPEPVAAETVVAETVVAEADARPKLRVVAWDEDAAYDLEPEPIGSELDLEPVVAAPEPEPMVAAVEREPEPEPMVAEPEPEPVAAEVEPEPVAAEVEPEPVAAEVEPAPEPEPVVAEEPAAAEPPAAPRIAPISETILRFPQRPAPPPSEIEPVAAEADSPELAARRAQLDMLGLGDPGEGPVQPTRPAVLPYRSRGAAVPQGDLAARAAAHGSSFWEASAREVAGAVAPVGVQNCGECGLSLSANARFCRRCGTRQAQSA